jgi:hypothetical protein
MRRCPLLGLLLALCGWLDGMLAGPVRAASMPTKQTVMVPMQGRRDEAGLCYIGELPFRCLVSGDAAW